MPTIGSIIDHIHPTASGIGIITTGQVWVVFDRAIDESTISAGNFFLAGPDFDTWSGPDLQLFLNRESLGFEDEILQSPGYHGLVQGEITFERVALDSLDVVNTEDTVGSGTLYRTKAILTPNNRLQANTEYTAYLSGDEDSNDLLETGISSITVFDTVTNGSNTGTGNAKFSGGYIGNAATDSYNVEITTAGKIGTSRFQFTRDSDPFTINGPFRTKRSGVLLSDCVTVSFEEGNYEVGDQWSVNVQARDIFTGNLAWPFKTGSGSIDTIPATTATSVIGDPVTPEQAAASSSTESFSVTSIIPADESSNVKVTSDPFDIVVKFNKNIDQNSLVDGVTAIVYSESVTGDPSIPASGELLTTLSSSNNELTITVDSGQLMQNNLVTITIDESLAATDSSTLGSDQEYWFTTTYYPMYCTLRVVKLKVGSFIQDVRDDTINMAIYVASREADMMTWNKNNLDNEYYQFARSQWVCCRAAHILLTNTIGGSGSIKSKRLGDLSVDYDTGNSNLNRPLQMAEECMAKWEGALMAGGRQVQTPNMVVKGDWDPDKPPVGRGWVHDKDIHNNQMPVGNRRVKLPNSRRFRNIYTRASFPKGWWK